jgi:hypothetical protein
MSTPSNSQSQIQEFPPSSKLILGNQCSNTYVCPGSGSGFAIQFNIIENDVSMLNLPSGYTVAASAVMDYTSVPQKALTNSPLTWWWKNVVLQYQGINGPTPMTCIQTGQGGFAVGLAQTLVTAFGISPSRICNAQLNPTLAPNSYDIIKIQFLFFITDIPPRTVPLLNDYLPSACVGPWMLSWIVKSTSVTDPSQSTFGISSTIPSKFQTNSCPALVSGVAPPTLYFTSKVSEDVNLSQYIENVKKSMGSSFSNKSFLNTIFVSKLCLFKRALAITAKITKVLSPVNALIPTSLAYPLKKSNRLLDPLGIILNSI